MANDLNGGTAVACSRWQSDVEGKSGLKMVGEVEEGLGSSPSNLIYLWCTREGEGAELGSMVTMAADWGKLS